MDPQSMETFIHVKLTWFQATSMENLRYFRTSISAKWAKRSI